MKKSVLFVMGLIFMLITYQCNTCGECFTPADPIVMRILSIADTTDLVYAGEIEANLVDLYYYEQDVKKNVEVEVFIDTMMNAGYLYSSYMAWISVSGTRDFYLALNEEDTDTLFLDVQRQEDECCTFHQRKAFRYNGRELSPRQNGSYYIYK